MNNQEAVVLTRIVKAACPQQAIDKYTPDAWFDLLEDLDFADCRAAVVTLGRRQPFIAPSEIRAEVRRVREDRIARAIAPPPPADMADRPVRGKYRVAVLAAVRRIADGTQIPPEIAGPLPGDPPADWQETREAMREASVVKPGPQQIAREQAEESRRERLAREAAEGSRTP